MRGLLIFKTLDLTDKKIWKRVGLIVAVTWGVFFVLAPIAMLTSLINYRFLFLPAETWVAASFVTIFLLIAMIPGSFALIYRPVRKHRLNIPEAGALSAFTLSFLFGFSFCLVGHLCFYLIDIMNERSYTCVRWASSCASLDDYSEALDCYLYSLECHFERIFHPLFFALIMGIYAFPASIGIAFPFGLCVGSALIIWNAIKETGFISKRRWYFYVGVSSLGWILATLLGYGLTK